MGIRTGKGAGKWREGGRQGHGAWVSGGAKSREGMIFKAGVRMERKKKPILGNSHNGTHFISDYDQICRCTIISHYKLLTKHILQNYIYKQKSTITLL